MSTPISQVRLRGRRLGMGTLRRLTSPSKKLSKITATSSTKNVAATVSFSSNFQCRNFHCFIISYQLKSRSQIYLPDSSLYPSFFLISHLPLFQFLSQTTFSKCLRGAKAFMMNNFIIRLIQCVSSDLTQLKIRRPHFFTHLGNFDVLRREKRIHILRNQTDYISNSSRTFTDKANAEIFKEERVESCVPCAHVNLTRQYLDNIKFYSLLSYRKHRPRSDQLNISYKFRGCFLNKLLDKDVEKITFSLLFCNVFIEELRGASLIDGDRLIKFSGFKIQTSQKEIFCFHHAVKNCSFTGLKIGCDLKFYTFSLINLSKKRK
ncbi:hypothetical protein EGR_07435 [Echinococcus granulosus]|uniref:Uncharacterized protein n=1 Tax=Echinococcus granulosus TaxID=6210 RepID=W6UW32_ECHGR|nr:hypothetical protein EGR_07435 [Echinococcus granulosus]EUB57694.1 hypothetical protein EGR_07435 [Echinococcus granulosus]